MKLKNIIKITGATAAGLAIANALIDNNAKNKNMFNDDAGYYYTWKEGNIYYTKKGSGPAILLIHDLNVVSCSYEYSKIINQLAKTNTVYTIDLLGCGQSDKPSITYTNFLYVQLINSFCKDVIGEKCHVIASHDSCPTVLMAQKLEGNFKKIILINPTDFETLSLDTTKGDMLFKDILFLPLIGTSIYNYGTSEDKIKEVLSTYFSKNTNNSNIIDAYYESAHLKNSNGRFLYACKKCNYLGCNIETAIAECKNLHLIVGSDYDNNNKLGDSYLEKNEKIKIHIINSTKQVPQLEDPEATLKEIKKIIK